MQEEMLDTSGSRHSLISAVRLYEWPVCSGVSLQYAHHVILIHDVAYEPKVGIGAHHVR